VIRASAPGKLMLAGEYTVVDPGGPALAVAVDARVTVEVVVDGSAWSVTSAELQLGQAKPDAVPVVASALAAVPGCPEGGQITVHSTLGVGDKKYGLGASAALAVATMAALHRAAGLDAPTLDACIAVHRAAQRGLGSGYDVATAFTGGVALFEPAAAGGPGPTVTALSWPPGLHAAVFHTGQGASTTALLDRVSCWRSEDPEDMKFYLDPLVAESREFIDAWKAADVRRILTSAAQLQEELDAFDRAGEIGIYGGGQMQLLAAVEDAGAIGRTSGAGGGDCVWALTDRAATLERATAAAAALGYTRLSLEFPEGGVNVGDL
jgi:phosphomevalonate kinase